MKTKSKNGTLTCPYCPKTFSHSRAGQGRAAHMRGMHPDKPFLSVGEAERLKSQAQVQLKKQAPKPQAKQPEALPHGLKLEPKTGTEAVAVDGKIGGTGDVATLTPARQHLEAAAAEIKQRLSVVQAEVEELSKRLAAAQREQQALIRESSVVEDALGKLASQQPAAAAGGIKGSSQPLTRTAGGEA